MKLLFVSTWFPHPLDTGSRIRVHHLLRALAARHEVHLVAFLPPSDERAVAFLPTLAGWGVRAEVVRSDPFRRDPVKARLAYLSPLPRDVVAGHSPEMERLVREALGRGPYDLVIASVIGVAPYVLGARGVPRVLEEHNYMTAWMEEQYRAQRSAPRRLARWVTWHKCRRYERRLFPQFDAVTMVSERDRRAVEATVPAMAGRVAVIPNGVDAARNRPGLAVPQPGTLVFNGAPAYYANADAMRWFCGEVLPAVRALRPGVRLQITGPHDGIDLGGIAGEEGVSLSGYLEDVRPAVAGSWACVVPLRQGGGTRLKILEALALGTPVVATAKGAEGLDVTHEHDILIADGPAEFARQTARLLGDPALRARLAANGRALVEAKYGWDRIGAAFCGVVEGAWARSPKRKQLTC